MPDASIYLKLCEILGISINELFAGEDISSEMLPAKSEANILTIVTKGKSTQKFLKKIIALLLIVSILALGTLGFNMYKNVKTENIIIPMDYDSTEVHTTNLINGINGAILYKYKTAKKFKRLELYMAKYEYGELIEKKLVNTLEINNNQSSDEGLIFLDPKVEKGFSINTILATEDEWGVNNSTKNSYLVKDVILGEDYILGNARVYEKKEIKYGEEQGLIAFHYSDKDGVTLNNIEENEKGYFIKDNKYIFYFTYKFVE